MIPAREQGLPLNRLDHQRLDHLVPTAREPTDADSTTAEAYIPTDAERAVQTHEQPDIGYTGQDAGDSERRKAVADYEKQAAGERPDILKWVTR